MAEFKGKQCDSCGAVKTPEEVVKYTQRFEGLGYDGERHLDLCGTCIEKFDLTDLKPIRRRGKKDEETGDTPGEPAATEPAKP